MPRVRPARLSGAWYPGEPAQLARTVREYLAGADPSQRTAGRPLLAIVPHAGYAYSGAAAGRLYGLLKGWHYERIFILAPSHRAPIRLVTLAGAAAFAMPGGEVAVDLDTVAALAKHPAFEVDDDAHAAEHAVEIQLPFLHAVFGEDLRIVPLLVPPRQESWLHEAAQALTPWCDGQSLFVVSTDFTHYGAAYGYVPFSDPSAKKLAELDQGAINRILAGDPAGLLAYGKQTGITMCGIHATAFALSAPLAAGCSALLVDYCRSGDQDGDYSLSVSYASLLLSRPQDETGETGRELTGYEQELLLGLARRALVDAVSGHPPLEPRAWARDEGRELTHRLLADSGAFVTLTKTGQLRGCIGTIEDRQPLVEAVAENAVAAATRDPRFPPVQASELANLHLEISVLTPLRAVSRPEDIVLGRDGIVLQKGSAKAVFLPQVPPEQGWDLRTTLEHLALKAGLGPDAWREGAGLQVFQAEVFGEKPQRPAS